MKYRKALDRVSSGTMKRNELTSLKQNAEELLAKGDLAAKDVLSAINFAKPSDTYILFMGFCPGADINERLDIEWKENGICRFDYLESEHQLDRFNTIYAGDLVVLKKREKFGKTMKLYGHGRVKSISYDDDLTRYFIMDWSDNSEIIEVPLMGCNSTVDKKSIDSVNREMPIEFFEWLKA